jgi:hypothetical protein
LLTEQSPPSVVDEHQFDALWTLAEAHSVDLLLAASVQRCRDLPSRIREDAAKRLAAAKLLERLRHAELLRVVDRIRTIDVLVLKGEALAYTVYAEPHLRPRYDVDLFVRHRAVEDVASAVVALGYTPRRAAALAWVQRCYERVDRSGIHYCVDLHWGVANPHPFAHVLPFERAWQMSVPVPRLGPGVRTLDHSDALLLACVHRVAHHHDSPRLLWLWDIHALANRMTPSQWERFWRATSDTGMRAVARRGLQLAHQSFGTLLPADIDERLLPADREEPAARFIGGLRLFDIAVTDMAAMRSWGERLGFLWKNLFPPLAHMRATYPRCPALLLPATYIARFFRGSRRWLRGQTHAGLSSPAKH